VDRKEDLAWRYRGSEEFSVSLLNIQREELTTDDDFESRVRSERDAAAEKECARGSIRQKINNNNIIIGTATEMLAFFLYNRGIVRLC
jgi:hypothetical protein